MGFIFDCSFKSFKCVVSSFSRAGHNVYPDSRKHIVKVVV